MPCKDSSITQLPLKTIDPGTDIVSIAIKTGIERNDDAVCVVNVSEVDKKLAYWHKHLPNVTPYYAIKCNPMPIIAEAVAKGGAGFDCASLEEIITALSVGANPQRIIVANPQLSVNTIVEAMARDVITFTFDSECELRKIIANTPPGKRARVVLRVLPPDESNSLCKFGIKFGANVAESKRLIRLSADLKANLVGFSFHVGSGCSSGNSYETVMVFCGELSEYAHSLGFKLDFADVGGGFISTKAEKHFSGIHKTMHVTPPEFGSIADEIHRYIEEIRPHFSKNMEVIAEPGRYLASDTMMTATRVVGRRILFETEGRAGKELNTEEDLIRAGVKISEVKYYLGDGCYGFFNNIFFDHATPCMRYFKPDCKEIPTEGAAIQTYNTTIFGPTCDSLDTIAKDLELPMLEIGDWVVCEAYGAYTYACVTGFNGIPMPTILPVKER